MENYPKYVTREAIESLVKKLSLPEPGPFTQDWEYEVADVTRINEFLSFYENSSFNEEERFALMIVIIESLNDAIEKGDVDESILRKAKELLLKDKAIHTNTIIYWSLESEDLEDCFAITPFIRCVKEMI
ncbi:hypothetical protein GC102_17235 [Paenibacillus sp. LMG 31460]|uniref:Uncharacterized protein n=1 Tax=Paenibacillus germinis TaxID=2654979 RepID=A0ABX1Z6M4_9BACL|nr:hypothetical protein [Paenibacillus germinis]NOU87515.1 hypothetical protein [Paenibacillus germinis]